MSKLIKGLSLITIIIIVFFLVERKASGDESILYENKTIHYELVKNEMVDTYLIAGAMYYEFKSPYLMPNTENEELYQKVKAHFEPYKEHSFIKNYKSYGHMGDINGDAIGVILSYSDRELKPIADIPQSYREGVFKTDASLNMFLKDLKDFYETSHAHDFFEENKADYGLIRERIAAEIETKKLSELIGATEKYINGKEKPFKNEEIKYQTVLTLYRPGNASFFKVNQKQYTQFITLLSANTAERDPNIMDIDQMVASNIHEILHNYINEMVKGHQDKIDALAQTKEKNSYVPEMYQPMPWYRIVDEYCVRAIEGRIYGQVFDENLAYKKIIEPEIKWGGFSKLDQVYKCLENYEMDRARYKSFDLYVEECVEVLFN